MRFPSPRRRAEGRGPLTVIEAFFDRENGASLKLPDGWIGRPFDNLYELTGVDSSGDALALQLNNAHELCLRGQTVAIDDGAILRLSGFETARWAAIPASPRPDGAKSRTFRAGGIEFFGQGAVLLP